MELFLFVSDNSDRKSILNRIFSIPGLTLLFLFFAGSLHSYAFPAVGDQPSVHRNIAQVHDLPYEIGNKNLLVHVTGVVTSYDPDFHFLFLQDKTGAIFVWNVSADRILPGDLLEVTGSTQGSFKTSIKASAIRKLGTAPFPAPLNSSFARIISGADDCLYVRIQGRVQAASIQSWASYAPYLLLELRVPGGRAVAQVRHFSPEDVKRLIGADISLDGVAAGIFDGTMQIISAKFLVEDIHQIHILHPHSEQIEKLPLTPLNQVMGSFSEEDASKRIRVRGSLTFYRPGAQMVLEENGRSVLINLHDQRPLKIGSIIEATGFPTDQMYSPSLRWGQILSISEVHPIAPKAISSSDARAGLYNFRLVKMTGIAVAQVSSDRADVLDLESEGRLVRAIFQKPEHQSLPSIPRGTKIEVVGVCFVEKEGPWNSAESFSLQLRTPGDITVLHQPSWWSVQHMIILVAWLSGLMLIAVLLVWRLQRKIARQTKIHRETVDQAALEAVRRSRIEAQRSHILEAINSRKPLDEVLALIERFMEEPLADCTCRIHLASSDQDILSNTKTEASPHRLQKPIVGGNNEVLGIMSLHSTSETLTEETTRESLDICCNLAALAIENRRLFGDLLYRSQYDQLTGIPNRYLLEKYLQEAIEEARFTHKHVGLIYVDVDFFKLVNDRYGHRTGDLYLQMIAQRLLNQLDNTGTIARVGGDEFIVVLPGIDHLDHIRQVADRLHRAFDEPFQIDAVSISGTASFGISSFPNDGETMDALKRKADEAMYEAKKSRHASETKNEPEQLTSEDLEHALRQERFLLHYQPQCTKDGEICGIEALVRMKSDSGKLIFPGDFIPTAEKSGLILSIGEWVLRTACFQLSEWHKTITSRLTMVVNVSGLQLQSNNYASQVIRILEETGVPPSSLELELTETILLENFDQCLAHMQSLRKLGVRFSIDDFGTGYSSLSLVHRLPIDTIKIDRAFIQGLHHQPSSQPVIRWILALAASVRVRVIAEGVEEKADLEKLVAEGCNYFQGFYFFKPKPPIDVHKLLQQQKLLTAPIRLSTELQLVNIERFSS